MEQKNFNIKRILLEIGELFELKRGLFRTIYHLSYKPNDVIDGYINNIRGSYSSPFRIIFLFTIVATLSSQLSRQLNQQEVTLADKLNYMNMGEIIGLEVPDWDYDLRIGIPHYKGNIENFNSLPLTEQDKMRNERFLKPYQKLNQKEKERTLNFVNTVFDLDFKDNPIFFLPALLLLWSIATFASFRERYKYYLEHFVINSYIITFAMLVKEPINFLFKIYFFGVNQRTDIFFNISQSIVFVVLFSYLMWLYLKIFSTTDNSKAWGIIPKKYFVLGKNNAIPKLNKLIIIFISYVNPVIRTPVWLIMLYSNYFVNLPTFLPSFWILREYFFYLILTIFFPQVWVIFYSNFIFENIWMNVLDFIY